MPSYSTVYRCHQVSVFFHSEIFMTIGVKSFESLAPCLQNSVANPGGAMTRSEASQFSVPFIENTGFETHGFTQSLTNMLNQSLPDPEQCYLHSTPPPETCGPLKIGLNNHISVMSLYQQRVYIYISPAVLTA